MFWPGASGPSSPPVDVWFPGGAPVRPNPTLTSLDRRNVGMTEIRPQSETRASHSNLRVGGTVMQRVDVRLEDDLTGGPADETVEFGVDGRSYEIDLNARHAADFRKQVARFLEHASMVRPARRRPPVRTQANRALSRQIRAWAEERGLDVSERGRLPREVIQQYESEHGASQRSEQTARRPGGRRLATSTGAHRRAPRKADQPGRGPRRGR